MPEAGGTGVEPAPPATVYGWREGERMTTGALEVRTLGRAAAAGWTLARGLVRGSRAMAGPPARVVAGRVARRTGLVLEIANAVARRAAREAMRAAEEEPRRGRPTTPAA
jgi:hypothetical protein